MNKTEFENKHLLTKEEIHDIMVERGCEAYELSKDRMLYSEFDKDELSDIVNKYIDYVNQFQEDNSMVINFYSIILSGKSKYISDKLDIYQVAYGGSHFFKYKDDKFFYWNFDRDKSHKENLDSNIVFLSFLLENYKDLGIYTDYLKYTLQNYKRNLKDEVKNHYLDLKEEYQKYDYVKILNAKNQITFHDVFLCMKFLAANDANNDFTVTKEERICFILIILIGVKNTYFKNSKLYIYQLGEEYVSVVNGVEGLFNDIKNFYNEKYNNDIVPKKIYSKDFDYYIDLKEEIKLFWQPAEKQNGIIRKFIKDEYIKEPLQLIYFEYLIKNNEYEKARKFINDNPIYLYYEIENCLDVGIKIKDRNSENYLLKESLRDYNLSKYDIPLIYVTSFDNESYNNSYVIPVLNFIINYLYLLRYEKQDDKVEYLYDFLKYFNKGFGIDDFFIKYEYEKALSKLDDLKTDNDDSDVVDETIDKISDRIDDLNMVNKIDTENVRARYPYINFDNLDEKVKKYIATGDTIMIVFDNNKNSDFDYSSAVIEWSKAVELETYNKLTFKVKRYSDQIIENMLDKSFKFGDTIGAFYKINEETMNDGRKMSEYLFDEYYSKIYDFDKSIYDELIENILKIHQTRNDSAHKYKSISFSRAKDCQSIILSAQKILAILSNLKEK